ncbi:wax ester/triacylglycerol synthase family O-acyltransferase [Streptomyces longispororuber]|uniref:wax ester/triacylglycerol synthase family O-acyltransferase n=1 Tax=Streptomyces longispororuber TaxID=68230 RepID=UPI00210CEBDB|nr:wax ester/triacylglycerol synthase family O-acyltransferase [Streptomyces longispororuber]MCQ4209037.1 wax ester/triacylglycerol synthase family O-acyltransferase [Streptomyces longispororuber]
MTAKSSDLLAPLDLAFWNIETAEHPMHLGALGVFEADAPGAAQHAHELLAARAAGVPGLRMRIAGVLIPVGGAARVPVTDFEPLEHVRLTAPVDDFHAAAGALMERPLDRRRPPWEAHVLPAADGASFAVLFKFHHALADGLRALTLAAAVMDPVDLPLARAPKDEPAPRRGLRLPFPGMREITLGDLDPRRYPGHVRALAGGASQALSIGASVARATWGVRTSPALTADASGRRRTAGVVLDLDDVHRIRKTVGGTVNDVLIAVVAGAVRRWLDERGDGSAGVEPRALVPVSRRRPRTAHPQGNRLSGYLVRLPVGEGDPLERLRVVRATMDRRKDHGPGRGAGAVALLADHVPPLGHRLGGAFVGQNARLLFDLLVTSVPLPSLGLKLGGCPLTEVFPLAPLAQGQSLAVAVSTYRGRVHYGLVADAAAVPDLDVLAGAVTDEVKELLAACGA